MIKKTKHRSPITEHRTGFTLIELLISLTIVGLIFGVGYVNFREFSRRQVVSSVHSQIFADLRLAQAKAISGEKPADTKCDVPNVLNGFGFRLLTSSSYQLEANCSGGTVLVKSGTISDSLTISTPTPNPILFKAVAQGTNIPSGQVDLLITLVGTGKTATVSVTAAGEIK